MDLTGDTRKSKRGSKKVMSSVEKDIQDFALLQMARKEAAEWEKIKGRVMKIRKDHRLELNQVPFTNPTGSGEIPVGSVVMVKPKGVLNAISVGGKFAGGFNEYMT